MSQGVVYIATGERFVEEALLSASSVQRQMPDVPICLFTDLKSIAEDPPPGIDQVILLTEVTRSCRDKIRPLALSPYKKTLFFDTDTYLVEPVYDLFELLDRFDIALAHAPDRYQYDLPQLPDCFTELNSGVIAFRNNEEVQGLLALWEKTFQQMLQKDRGSYRDQHSLRDALYRSSVRLYILPQEYNFRTICPNFAGKHCNVKIIHGRHADIEQLAQTLNRNIEARVFLSSPYKFFSQEIRWYDSWVKAALNTVFETLPLSIRNRLSALRNR
ncbi:MAG: hypothetical protein Q3M24_03100 [Candidatus Electrothrix aestuarii]|uniref:Nucleotide-diphospho-sugar transferase n=1 Tax=Candidatus Electrothrix aestuarii TaxID=3062594 RepID=A0AAU8LY14_9BACT|nr:hypothetical protein [Candidatus Electrothrix aestuarii]